jgi:hypothetical protein
MNCNGNSDKAGVKQAITLLKAAYRRGGLKGHPARDAISVKGREVLASWGSAMRR